MAQFLREAGTGSGAGGLRMKNITLRSVIRWFHILLAIPIVGYIYSPFEVLPGYAIPTRYGFLPAMVLSGLWMWKGHVLGRLVSRTP
jgi:thiosulfate reductase cytochrome b subunit